MIIYNNNSKIIAIIINNENNNNNYCYDYDDHYFHVFVYYNEEEEEEEGTCSTSVMFKAAFMPTVGDGSSSLGKAVTDWTSEAHHCSFSSANPFMRTGKLEGLKEQKVPPPSPGVPKSLVVML